MGEKIMTLHPEEGKSGVNISKRKYDVIKETIVASLRAHDVMTFTNLNKYVHDRLGSFDGSISWYVTTVKLDLEARQVVERIPGTSPQQLQLVKE